MQTNRPELHALLGAHGVNSKGPDTQGIGPKAGCNPGCGPARIRGGALGECRAIDAVVATCGEGEGAADAPGIGRTHQGQRVTDGRQAVGIANAFPSHKARSAATITTAIRVYKARREIEWKNKEEEIVRESEKQVKGERVRERTTG